MNKNKVTNFDEMPIGGNKPAPKTNFDEIPIGTISKNKASNFDETPIGGNKVINYNLETQKWR